MNKLINKRIIGLFIFALTITLFNIKTVYARSCEEVVSDLNHNETQLIRYGLIMNYDGESDSYIIEENITNGALSGLTKYDSSFTKTKAKFKIGGLYFFAPGEDETKDLRDENGNTDLVTGTQDITSRLGEFISSGEISSSTITHGGTIKIKRNIFRVNGDVNKIGLAVKLVPDGFNDPELVNACSGNPSFFAVVYTVAEVGDEMKGEEYSSSYITDTSLKVGIDCSNPKDTFEINFCTDKTNALRSTTTRKFTIREYKNGNMIKYENNDSSKVFKPNDALAFKCDYNDLVVGGADDSKYYVNKKYLYGEGQVIITEGTYQYSEDENVYSKKDLKLDASCELKCEEVVKVEYGPPVASKAGLCFEYKVKVTSRVNCEMVKEPNQPPKQVVCTPTPWCNHPGGYPDYQGGPNDDFDSCVEECDGGVYSDKCVNKCYKQVYGTSVVRKTTGTEVTYDDVLELDDKPIDVLYEYKYKNKRVIWDVGSKGGTVKRKKADGSNVTIKGGPRQKGFAATVVPTDSYWHKNNYWGYYSSVYTLYDRVGIPRKANCSASCSWKLNSSSECKNKTNARYLNSPNVYKGTEYEGQSDFEKDQKKNKEIWENLQKRCAAYASCNTTTAEFTISVDYTEKGSSTKQTIEFPYTTDKKATVQTEHEKTSCLPEEKSTIILHSDGCYNCSGANSKKEYMTEWSFPGTWIHTKSGKISYNPDSATTTAWRKIKDKFCLPLNIANVNEKWYNYYQKVINGDDTSYSFNNTEYISSITCPDGKKLSNSCEYKNSTFTKEDAEKLDYNINATARKFGMYEWDLDISCFYAVNELFPKVSEDDKCETRCDDDTEIRVRSVDLDNLFPDKSGNKLTDSSQTGRTPGFNWTSFAEQTNKDTDYISLPSNYAKWVQAKGTSVYSDEYLDYEINLTKEAISEIKKQFNSGMNKKYTNWEGETEINSVVNYQSPLFRNGGILSKNSKYPVGNAITCNNMKNYRSTECEDFSGEVR